MTEYYEIDSTKLQEITFYVRTVITGHTDEDIHDYIIADWPEGQEHQEWLDSAPVAEIAGWVIVGLKDNLSERMLREEENRRMDEINNLECESCAESGQHGEPAVGHSKNPEWSGYNLCQNCIDEYDSRDQIYGSE